MRLLLRLADAVLAEVEVGLLRLGERLLAYGTECLEDLDPTPEFPEEHEEVRP